MTPRAVRAGKSLAFRTDALGCMGARRYLGFADTIRPDFEYFLSTPSWAQVAARLEQGCPLTQRRG